MRERRNVTPQVPRGDVLYPAQIRLETSVGHSDRLYSVKSTMRKPHSPLNNELFSENPQPSAETVCPSNRERTSNPAQDVINDQFNQY